MIDGMMGGPDKKALVAIMGPKKPKVEVEVETEDGAEQDKKGAKEALASDILKAIEAKDAMMLADAVEAMVEYCKE